MSNYIKRPLRHITGSVWPGYLAEHDAKAAFAKYRKATWNIARLRDAVDWYQLAVDQRRKHKHHLLPTTLVSCAATVWVRYTEKYNRLSDLKRAISLGEEALSIWPQGFELDSYAVLLDILGSAWAETYKIALEDEIAPKDDTHAFYMACNYLNALRLMKIDTVPLLQRKARMQRGILIRMRYCRRESNLMLYFKFLGIDCLEGVYHEVQMALKKGYSSTGESEKDMNNVIATCVFNLAFLYELHYKLAAGNVEERLACLNTAIDYNTQAKVLIERYYRPERDECIWNLAWQLFLRWRITGNQVDFDTAMAMTEVAKKRLHGRVLCRWGKKFHSLHALLAEVYQEKATEGGAFRIASGAPSRSR